MLRTPHSPVQSDYGTQHNSQRLHHSPIIPANRPVFKRAGEGFWVCVRLEYSPGGVESNAQHRLFAFPAATLRVGISFAPPASGRLELKKERKGALCVSGEKIEKNSTVEKAAESKKDLPPRGKKILGYGLGLVLLLVVTNPSILWFLPEETRGSLLSTWQGVFGDVEAISRAIRINWVSLFQVAAVILALSLLTNLVHLAVEHIHPKTGKTNSILSMVGSFTSYAAVLVGIVWCLSAVGVDLSTIFASLGIVALIIGFAAESLIADIITGVFLVFEDEFNVGDIVEINGFRGTVTSIGIRVTCVRDAGGNIKVVNNSDIRDVLNRSKTPSWAICDAPIAYSADLERAEEVLQAILEELPEKYPEKFPSVPTYLGVQELSASSVNLRVAAEVAEANVFSAGRLLNREIKLGLDRAGVEIPFQQVVVHQAKEK